MISRVFTITCPTQRLQRLFVHSISHLDLFQCPVNHVEWSPFSGNVFLSCSSDSYIQLWSQDHYTPVMTFATTQKVVLAVRWSLKQSTVFAAIYGQQVEIWDLNQNM